MRQNLRCNDGLKTKSLEAILGLFEFEESIIARGERCKRNQITNAISPALFSNNNVQNPHRLTLTLLEDEVEISKEEWLADLERELTDEFNARALIANSQRKFFRRNSSTPDMSKVTCYTCGKIGHMQKDCFINKTSTPSYPSSSQAMVPTQQKPFTQFTKPSNSALPPRQESKTKDLSYYKNKFNKLKAKYAAVEEKADKGLIAETNDWGFDESSDDDEEISISCLMALAEDDTNPTTEQQAQNGKWVNIIIKKVLTFQKLESNDDIDKCMTSIIGDLRYVEELRLGIVSKSQTLINDVKKLSEKLEHLEKTELELQNAQARIIRMANENKQLLIRASGAEKILKSWNDSRTLLDKCLSEQIPANVEPIIGRETLEKDCVTETKFVKSKETYATEMLKKPILGMTHAEGIALLPPHQSEYEEGKPILGMTHAEGIALLPPHQSEYEEGKVSECESDSDSESLPPFPKTHSAEPIVNKQPTRVSDRKEKSIRSPGLGFITPQKKHDSIRNKKGRNQLEKSESDEALRLMAEQVQKLAKEVVSLQSMSNSRDITRTLPNNHNSSRSYMPCPFCHRRNHLAVDCKFSPTKRRLRIELENTCQLCNLPHKTIDHNKQFHVVDENVSSRVTEKSSSGPTLKWVRKRN